LNGFDSIWHWVAISVGILFFILLLTTLRKNRFTPGYTVLWLGVGIFLITIPLLDNVYVWLNSRILDSDDAKNIIYVFFIGFLLVYIYYMTSDISKLNDKVQTLNSYIALLEKRLRDTESQIDSTQTKSQEKAAELDNDKDKPTI